MTFDTDVTAILLIEMNSNWYHELRLLDPTNGFKVILTITNSACDTHWNSFKSTVGVCTFLLFLFFGRIMWNYDSMDKNQIQV